MVQVLVPEYNEESFLAYASTETLQAAKYYLTIAMEQSTELDCSFAEKLMLDIKSSFM